jgi:flagellar FliL protein
MANGGDGVATAGRPESRRLRWFVIVAAILVLGGGGAAAAYLAGLLPSAREAGAASHDEPGPHEEAGAEPAKPAELPAVVFVDLPDLVVNLQSDARRMRFLKLRLALEVADEPTALAVRGLMPRVMDGFQLYLRALTAEDLNGAAGLQRLKEELIARVNLAVDPVRVNDVLLKEMLVQ